MKGLQKKRRALLTVIIAEGVLAIIAIIGVAICYVQLEKFEKISITHNADIQDFYAGFEEHHEKITELEARAKLEKVDFAWKLPEPPTTVIWLKEDADPRTNFQMTAQVEYETMEEALKNPYSFTKKEKEVKFSACTDSEKIAMKIYFFEDLTYTSMKEGLKNPVFLDISGNLEKTFCEKKFCELGIYLAELTYKDAEFYFAFQLK